MTSSSATYLDRILVAHRQRAADDRRPLADLIDAAQSQPPPRGFTAALRAVDGLAVIAEVKRRSPSRGDLGGDLDPARLVAAYARGGATCLSVLTDQEFFGGSPDDLRRARAAVDQPVLRKDFTVAPADVCDARIMGADAVLLIVAALDDAELRDLHDLARELGLDVLVEVHDERELERASALGAELIGVNQRDLFTFAVDPKRAVRLARAMPPSVVAVAESGIGSVEAARALRQAGFAAVLVGEWLVRSPDPAAAVAALRSA
jgi:indole-3-glycerol phosphate synthase